MKTTALLAALVCTLAAGLPARALTLDEVRDRIAQDRAVAADFVMTKKSPAVDVDLVSRGRLLLVRGRGLLWTTAEPFEEVLGFSLRKRGATDESGKWTVLENRHADAAARQVEQLLSGDAGGLESRFFVTLEGDLDGWRAVLTPKSGNAAQWIAEILIRGGRHISRMQLVMKDGTLTEIVFSNPRANPEIDALDDGRLESLQ